MNQRIGRRGSCLVIFGIVVVVFLVGIGVVAFVTLRWIHRQVETYTATSAVPLPKSKLSDADYAKVDERVTQFTDALNHGQSTPPLILDEQELNAYIEHTHPNDLGKEVYLVLDGNQVKGEVSFPLDSLNVSWVKDRYLNGNVTLDVSLANHNLVVTAQQIEVNGQSPPVSFMRGFSTKNLAKDATKNPKNAAEIAKFESIEIKDGKLIVTAPPAATP